MVSSHDAHINVIEDACGDAPPPPEVLRLAIEGGTTKYLAFF
jgi:hypothetical protein